MLNKFLLFTILSININGIFGEENSNRFVDEATRKAVFDRCHNESEENINCLMDEMEYTKCLIDTRHKSMEDLLNATSNEMICDIKKKRDKDLNLCKKHLTTRCCSNIKNISER